MFASLSSSCVKTFYGPNNRIWQRSFVCGAGDKIRSHHDVPMVQTINTSRSLEGSTRQRTFLPGRPRGRVSGNL